MAARHARLAALALVAAALSTGCAGVGVGIGGGTGLGFGVGVNLTPGLLFRGSAPTGPDIAPPPRLVDEAAPAVPPRAP